jgi:hypothetical protein
MKQQLLNTAVALFSATTLFAQLPVNQSPENKNVVLEEFTGIHCVYCPDGHLRAQTIKNSNPDDVVLINIHVGSYASPSAGEPDFRTPFGSAIAGQSGLSGYPSGTVNRHVFEGSSTALNRGKWSTYSNIMFGIDSYANIALQSSLDITTRELTVDVEVYYTGNGSATNKINVALLQNGIEGPQTGMSGNPSQVLANGKYQHNHMLRHMLTGQWGDVVTTTSQGTLIQRQYTYTIPAALYGVNYVLEDLEVVAFLAEGNQEVITGAEGPIFIGTANVKEENKQIVGVNAYPNPTSGDISLEIKLTEKSLVNVQVLNNLGQVVVNNTSNELSAGTSNINLSLEGLKNGIYYAHIEVAGSTTVKRIAVMK